MQIPLPPKSKKTARRYYLDWLRVIAFFLLILFHTSLVFRGWHVTNKESSRLLEAAMHFVSQWRMPLLFIISGAGVYFSLKNRSEWAFIKERFKRLLIPLVFGTLIVVPPQMYYHRVFRGASFDSYWHFHLTVFEFKWFPEGNFNYLHLWFIAYILLYSLFTLPLFIYLQTATGKKFTHQLSVLLEKKGLIFLLVVPLTISDVLLRLYWESSAPFLGDLDRFVFFLLLFTYGYLLFSQERLLLVIVRYRKRALLAGIVSAALLYLIRSDDQETLTTGFVFYRFLRKMNMLWWVFSIIGYARVYLNFNHSLLNYANQAVYPFYILHQTVMIALAYYVIQWQAGIVVKFLVISLGTCIITLLLYEFFVRRNKVTRLLFGLKPLKSIKEPSLQRSVSVVSTIEDDHS